MEVVFSNHASLKIEQRNISRQLVLKTVNSPDFSQPSRNFREEFYKKFGGKYLKVVIKRDKKSIIVVTAHWIAKYKHN